MISGVGIDWLEGYIPPHHFDAVVSLLNLHTLITEPSSESPFRPYTHRFKWAEGIELSIKFDESTMRPGDSLLLVFRGAAFGGRSLDDVHQLSMGLSSLEFDCKRIDVRYDDADKRIMPDRLWFDYVSRGLCSGPKSRHYVTQDTGGGGVYIGKKGKDGGGVEHCIYDKSAQTGGELDCVRWETRFWRKKAPDVWAYLNPRHLEEDVPLDPWVFAERIASLVGGGLEFWQDADHTHLDRRQHAPWWAGLRQVLGSGATFLGAEE